MRGKSVRLAVDFSVNEGQLVAFQAIAKRMTEVSESEPGTLVYDWFFEAEGRSCRLLEEYVDAAALTAHFAGAAVKELVPELVQFGGVSRFEVYGDPGPEAGAMAAGLGAKTFAYWGGMKKGR
jgi:quinol monooxygenase YgiN